MAGRHRWEDVRAEAGLDTPEFDAELELDRKAYDAIYGLGELRKSRDKLQGEVAETMGTSQANVSRIERESNLRLGTLARYVEALEGRLEVRAIFYDHEVVFRPVRGDDEDAAAKPKP
jgi:DNA-binding XRE family transcriptional regulator